VFITDKAKHLQTLFLSDSWKGRFKTLSDTIGFNLRIYSEDGNSFFSIEEHYPMCSGLLSAPDFRSKCDAYCHNTMMGAFSKGLPIIYKCYAKIMSFAFPVEYIGEKVVILGQGSFSAYEDFREFIKHLSFSKVKDFAVTCPLKFTTAEDARNACNLVDSSITQLLKTTQETITLKKKVDSLKEVLGMRGVASNEQPETLLQTILDRSAELLKAEQGSLMLLDHETELLIIKAKRGINNSLTEKLRIQKGEGIAGKVAEFGEPFLVGDVENDPRIKQKNRLRYKTRSFVSVPITIEGRIIGVLNLSDKITGEIFNKEDLELIQSFADQAAIVMERNVFYTQTEELRKLAVTDPLTGLLNRRYLSNRLEEELLRSERHGRFLSLLMVDIDGFKGYNDTFGHPIGDKALKATAESILRCVRSVDIAFRYGGDEFVIILPETGKTLAVSIAERLRSDVAEIELPPGGLTLTISIGIASYPEDGKISDLLLENVDKALYFAKNRGGNRIEVFS